MHRSHIPILGLTLSVSLALAGCGSARQLLPGSDYISGASKASGPMESSAPGRDSAGYDMEGGAGSAAAPQGVPAAVLPSSQHLIIRNAELSLQASDVAKSEAAIRGKVDQLGGYVVQAETSGSEPTQTTRLTVRVPAAKFDEAIAFVETQATKLLGRNISGNDVTEEFVDLESRQKTLEATRDRLLDMLNKAEDVDEALKVNTALNDIQGQLDQTLGRKKFLSESASLSSISVSLYPDSVAAPIVEEDAWAPVAVAREALRGLVAFAQWFLSLLIVAAIWSPVWIGGFLVLRWMRRRWRKSGPVAALRSKTSSSSSKGAEDDASSGTKPGA